MHNALCTDPWQTCIQPQLRPLDAVTGEANSLGKYSVESMQEHLCKAGTKLLVGPQNVLFKAKLALTAFWLAASEDFTASHMHAGRHQGRV